MNADAHPGRAVHDLLPPPTLVRLLDDHRRLDTVLVVVDRHLRDGSMQEPAILDLLACLTDYINEFPERIHHPREDLITERLVDKGLTPGERALVELTVSQHAELAAQTQRVAQDVDRLLMHKRGADEVFRQDVRRYLEMQRDHMKREEQQLFPLALRLLSADDWREIERGEARTADPVTESQLDRYHALYELVSADLERSRETDR